MVKRACLFAKQMTINIYDLTADEAIPCFNRNKSKQQSLDHKFYERPLHT